MDRPTVTRRPSRQVSVGGVTIGGDAPIRVQSMTTTTTADVEATIEQVALLAGAGAELVRVSAATPEDTAGLARIVRASPVPIVADVHFHFARALEAVAAGAAKLRLNPGNITDRGQVREVIAAASERGVVIRVGVNEGSAVDRADPDRRAAELAKPVAQLMADKLAAYLDVFAEAGFEDLILSAKSADALTCIAVNRLLADRWDYPLHLGVTHAGPAATAGIRSAAALGALLAEGIGDTIRLSFAGDPLPEVSAAWELLWSLRLRERTRPELIACPTCGRLQMDLADVVAQLRDALAGVPAPLTVAVMGCVVNGPGEADHADVAVCAGRGKAMLYRHGRRLRTVQRGEIVQAVLAEVRRLTDS